MSVSPVGSPKRVSAVKKTVLFTAVALAAATVAMAVLAAWRPFKEQGGVSSLSGGASRDSAEADGNLSNYLIAGIDQTDRLTDVIMVISLNKKTGKACVLQIPRDTYAGSDIPSGKYNAVYGHAAPGDSGMETLKARIERDFGISLDHYAAITTKGFDSLVDSVGGVDIYVPVDMNYDDDEQDLHIHLKKGYQHLTGSQAEQLVRDRKDWSEGDLGRLQMQKSFLAVLAGKLKSQSALSLSTKVLPSLAPPDFKTDMSTLELLSLGDEARKLSLEDVTIYTMPGEACIDPDNGLSLYSVHKKELLPILNANFMPQGQTLTLSDLKIIQKAGEHESSSKTASGSDFAALARSASLSR